jgi:hypothetical protein
MMSKLLIDEPPLQVLPSLAYALGLNEAIFLQQLHYWLRATNHWHDDRPWVYNTYEGWQKQFPFWSVPTIRRAITTLRESKLITTTDAYNKLGFDNTLWYTINYDAVAKLEIRPSDQNDQTTRSNRSEDVINLSRPIPETNTENSAKKKEMRPTPGRKPKDTRPYHPDEYADVIL